MQVFDWLVPGASVAVAFVTFGGVVYTAHRNKEPRMSEVWAENSNLRDRLDKQDEKIGKQDDKIDQLETNLETTNTTFRRYKEQAEQKIGILGAGFDVLFRKFTRDGSGALSKPDQDAVDAARALRLSSNTHPIVLDLNGKGD